MSYTIAGEALDTSVHFDGVPDGTYLKLSSTRIVPVTWDYGYQVAYTEFRAPRGTYTTTEPERVWSMLDDHYVDEFVGVWTDDEGVIYVERCYWIEEQFPAEELGRAWHQKAIWDWSASEEVTL